MHETKMVQVNGSDMPVLIFRPEGPGPHPAMLVCQHIPTAHASLETDPWQISVGERLAKAG